MASAALAAIALHQGRVSFKRARRLWGRCQPRLGELDGWTIVKNDMNERITTGINAVVRHGARLAAHYLHFSTLAASRQAFA
jgi:hypothetical protein